METIVKELDRGWRLTLAPNAQVQADGFDPHTAEALRAGGYPEIPASVPGNFELDLVAAGLAPDPYFAQNPLAFRQYENRHLWYAVSFSADPMDRQAGELFLRFAGIDTVADIWLNGALLGHTENMLIPHEFPVGGKLKAENELLVHIYPTTLAARRYPACAGSRAQRYEYESLHTRKCASMFGWDIMPRFVSGGIWRPVTLVCKPRERFAQFYLYTTAIRAEGAYLVGFYDILTDRDDVRELTVSLDMVCGESVLHAADKVWHTNGHLRVTLAQPMLWFPRNAGEPNLYDVTAVLRAGDTVLDERHFRFGIRTAELIRTSTAGEDGSGEFLFRINGKKVYCMGTNWVPLDAFHSRDRSRLERTLALLRDSGSNMIRCWGGNVYEDDAFFDFCDENGIMVWQDFAMGCAVYPQDAELAQALYREAVSVIHRLRNHASLTLWSGDNEVDAFYGWNYFRRDPNQNVLTREILPRALREHDEVRPYLPSSPYIDEVAFRENKPAPEAHLWADRPPFRSAYYKDSPAHFVSEIGYPGAPSPASLRQFISADQLWPIRRPDGTLQPDWICHGTDMDPETEGPYAFRVGLILTHVERLFGALPETLSDFCRASQISQAEALKFFAEHFRIGKWRRTGLLWWNLADGWPQASEATVDWYGRKKLAYGFLQRSQQPLLLAFDEPQDGVLPLCCVSDGVGETGLQWSVTDVTDGVPLATGSWTVRPDCAEQICRIPAPAGQRFLLIEWRTADGVCGKNHYSTQDRNLDLQCYLRDLARAGLDAWEGFDGDAPV